MTEKITPQISIIKKKNIYEPKLSPNFTSKRDVLLDGIDSSLKPIDKFVKSQENLSSTRFVQDVATNWIPKVVFTRSLADFTEMTFLEFTESALFYFVPALLGETVLRSKVFLNFAKKNERAELNKHISKNAGEILSDAALVKSGAAKKVLPIKAAIILACTCIPAAEYALSFAKNLLTLKLFKKSNFNNIANLDKGQKEDEKHQEFVRKSAYRHIKNAGFLSVGALAGSALLAGFGHKSSALQKFSSLLLQPGAHLSKGLKSLGLKSKKLDYFLKTYITPDFAGKNGKLSLSKGQLLVSTCAGFFGYAQAGKDRGKLDYLEVLTRVPFVVFYTTFGSSLFDDAFKHILAKKNKYKDLVKKADDGSISIPSRAELPDLARKIAKERGTNPQAELNTLLKQKGVTMAVPYGFALVFMGFLLAGITRFWTQYRYNHGEKQTNPSNTMFTGFDDIKSKKAFSAFK